MKKIISLVIALAMIISCVPMFGLTASAEVETYTLFDASVIDTSTHGDISLTDYGWTGNEGGVCFSSQWSASGTWNASPWGAAGLMFFRSGARANGQNEDKVATIDDGGLSAGAEKIVIEYTFAMQDQNNNYQTWRFNDLDGNAFATVYYDQGVKATTGPAGGDSTNIYANGSAAVYALRGKSMKIEAVKGDSDWTVTYTSDGKLVGTDTVASVNGISSISANIGQWNNQYAAMALQGLKISVDVDASNIAEITVKTVLSDGTPSGVEDKTILVSADGTPYTYVPKSTAPLNVDGTYYVYNKDASTLTITPTVGGDNVIELVYDKFSGTGLTGSVIADGATCWFADPRTLTVKGDGVNYTYIGYIDNYGNVKATQYDNLTGDYEEVLVRSNLQPDDHNNPTFLELPDHRIMIFYSRHTDEACFYYRVSKEPYDITTLAEERRLITNHNTTYPNPFILEGDPDHIYLTWRGVNWHPTIAQLEMPTADNDYTTEYTWGPRQIVQSNIQGSGCRPYAKYTSNGVDKIWLTYTGTHPDNVGTNPIYCNYISIPDLTLHDVNGAVLNDLKSSTQYTVSGSETNANSNIVVDRTDGWRDWVWEIALDKDDSMPVIAMVKIDGSKKVHNYFYAKYTGSEWNKFDLPDPAFNTFFHKTPATENCYSGGMSIDKDDPHIVYASIPVDGVFGRVFEIVKWTLNDDYTAIANEEFITENSAKDNARPYVSNGSAAGDLRITWFNGDYYYWIHSNQHGGKGYPVQMMTTTELKELPVDNDLGDIAEKIYAINGNTETVPVTAGEKFTISMDILQNDISVGGTLLKSGNFQIDLEKQTVDKTHDYAAVAPKLTVDGTVEKSQNLLSDSAWYFSLGGTGGTKGQSTLGWFNYTITYDGSEVVTYVNGLIDATMQNVNVALGDEIEIGGINGIITNVRSTDAALTQAEVRAAAAEFKPGDINTLDAVTIPAETVTDLVLPAKTADGKAITWTSSNTAVMDNTGAVTRDGKEHKITLKAEANGKTKNFTVTVLAKVNVETENLVFKYNFNNVEDGIVPDVSGNGLDAEILGSAKITDGKLDLTANTADGWDTNGYMNVPHDFLQGVRSYTVVQQISGGTDRKDPRLYDFGANSGNSMFTRLNTLNGNRYQAGLKYAGGTTLMVAGGSYPAGEYWLVTTYNAVTKVTTVYTVDAEGNIATQASGTDVTYQPYQIAGTTDRNFIGRAQWVNDTNNRGNNQDFNGTIDNFMFFNTALNTEEITAVTGTASVKAEAALRIVEEDGTATLSLAFTANVSGNTEGATAVGFEYGIYAKDEDGNYTVLPEELKDASVEGVPASFRLIISGISNANSARIYAVKPYVMVDGRKVYGELVTATLYGELVDSIINGAGNTILPARLAAANSVIAFVKANRNLTADSNVRFPGLAEATAMLYDENGELCEKAKGLGISDDASAIITPQMAEALSLESVEIEFVETEVAESETFGDITTDLDFTTQL